MLTRVNILFVIIIITLTISLVSILILLDLQEGEAQPTIAASHWASKPRRCSQEPNRTQRWNNFM